MGSSDAVSLIVDLDRPMSLDLGDIGREGAELVVVALLVLNESQEFFTRATCSEDRHETMFSAVSSDSLVEQSETAAVVLGERIFFDTPRNLVS
jgi:hypothetical protein